MSPNQTEEGYDPSPKKELRRQVLNRGDWLAIAVLVNTILFLAWLLTGSAFPLFLVGVVVVAMIWGFRNR
jgi:fatty acid desaturase